MTAGETKSLQPDASGIFTDATPGIVGHEYRIDVATGGQTYTSTSIMRPHSEICGVEFQWIKMPYDHVAVLQVSFTDPSSAGDYYWVRLYRNGEAYKWSVLDDSRAFDGIINEVLMTSRMDIDEEDDNTVLLDGDVVTVTVSAISREMADYLEALQSDSNGPCMFSGSFCLGYFLASPVAESEIVFRPDQMDVAG